MTDDYDIFESDEQQMARWRVWLRMLALSPVILIFISIFEPHVGLAISAAAVFVAAVIFYPSYVERWILDLISQLPTVNDLVQSLPQFHTAVRFVGFIGVTFAAMAVLTYVYMKRMHKMQEEWIDEGWNDD